MISYHTLPLPYSRSANRGGHLKFPFREAPTGEGIGFPNLQSSIFNLPWAEAACTKRLLGRGFGNSSPSLRPLTMDEKYFYEADEGRGLDCAIFNLKS
jgi:hypothetical protein